MNPNKPETVRSGRFADERRRSPKSSERRRRWFFLLVDILLLLVVLTAVFFLVVILTPLDLFKGSKIEERSIVYTVELAGVDRDSIEALAVGDTVTDTQTGSAIGIVTEVHSRPYEAYTDIPTTEMDAGLNSYLVTKNTYPDNFKTVTVTVRATADYESGIGYTVERSRIAVGRSYDLRFSSYSGSGVCVTLATVGGE